MNGLLVNNEFPSINGRGGEKLARRISFVGRRFSSFLSKRNNPLFLKCVRNNERIGIIATIGGRRWIFSLKRNCRPNEKEIWVKFRGRATRESSARDGESDWTRARVSTSVQADPAAHSLRPSRDPERRSTSLIVLSTSPGLSRP